MNVCRRLRLPSAAVAVLSLGLTGLTACSSSTAADSGRDGDLDVVASFYPLEYLVEEIGGDRVSVTTLTEPGTEPHDLEISPRKTARIGEADMAVHIKGLQPAVDEAIEQSGNPHPVDAGAAAAEKSDEHGHHEEDGHDRHGAEESGAHGHDDGHGHEGATDPHIWLDPVQYARTASGIGKALEKADPGHAAEYRKNTDVLVEKLHALDEEFSEGLKNRRTDTFVTTHAAFGHLAERYGLHQEAVNGLDPDAGPSPARMKDLHRIAAEEGVTTVFFETLAGNRTARTLADDTGLRTDVLDPLEGITDRSRGDDYLEVMRANLAALEKALGAQ